MCLYMNVLTYIKLQTNESYFTSGLLHSIVIDKSNIVKIYCVGLCNIYL